jgi:tetratricopeptide (TPR) repeat protein
LWQQALATGEAASVPEHQAWIESQMANNRFITGDISAADQAYARSLAAFPQYVHALAGLGRTAAARQDYATAIDFYRRAIDVQPLPEYVTALGDVYTASGDDAGAQDQYALVGAIEQLYAANGVNLDLQIALFNADHGRELPETASRAQELYAAQPSIQAADALAWAQFQAGNIDAAKAAIDAALATGSGEPLFLYHAGEIYRAAGDDGRALTYFQWLGASNPRFSPLHAQAAVDALAALSATAQSRGL